MEGYYGIVESVIRRGEDAYQLTFRIKQAENAGGSPLRQSHATHREVLIYRADITIEDNRFILFPDRELGRCMDAYSSGSKSASISNGLVKEQEIGKVADRICRRFSSFLVEQMTTELRSAGYEDKLTSDVSMKGDLI